MTYKEYRENQEKAISSLPIFYAFSDKQFENAMRERNLTGDDTDKIYRLGNTGGFYLKKDSHIIKEYFSVDHSAELRNLMESDHAFAKEAIEYEMYNHEYPINWEGDYDVASCFGYVPYEEGKDGTDYLSDLGFSKEIINIWNCVRSDVCSHNF